MEEIKHAAEAIGIPSEKIDQLGEELRRQRQADLEQQLRDASQPQGEPVSADNYILIQANSKGQWVAQMGFNSSHELPDADAAHDSEIYDTFEDAVTQNIERASETEYGMKISKYDAVMTPGTSEEQTLTRVYTAFRKLGVDMRVAIKIVKSIHEEGVVFKDAE